MITVAANRENKFSNSNNKARFEDNEEEAINVDNNIKEAWSDHPNLKMVPVCDYLEDKIQMAVNYVDDLLKEKDQ